MIHRNTFVSLLFVVLALSGRAFFVSLCAAENRVFEPRLFGRVEVRVLSDGCDLVCRSPESAIVCASKYLTDLLQYGDAKLVSDSPTVVSLDAHRYCRVSVAGDTARMRFAASREELERRGNDGAPVERNRYPRWFDRFDNDAAGMGFFGWGDNAKDIYADFAWTRKYFRRILEPFAGETDYLAPGVYDTSTTDWWLLMARRYDFSADIYQTHTYPGRPQFTWNVVPLPHIKGNGFQPIHEAGRLALAQYSQYTPLPATDPFLFASQRAFASSVKGDPRYGSYFAAAEIGDLAVPFLTASALDPETRDAWHRYLRDELKWSLTEVGLRHYGDSEKFRSWDEVPVPVLRNFAGWNPRLCRDLLAEKWQMTRTPRKDAKRDEKYDGFFPVRPNDPILQSYQTSDAARPILRFRTEFTVSASELPNLKYLHIEPIAWHRSRFYVRSVALNGRDVKNIAKRTPSVFADLEDCFTLDGLRTGINVLEIETDGSPFAGYVFAGPQGRWTYPSGEKRVNRRYFDAVEFSAVLRARHLEDVLENYRRGDGNTGRPQLVMACGMLLDKFMPIMARHGGFPHDTGMAGITFCPWTTGYGATYRLPSSAEPGIYPHSPEDFQRLVTFYLTLGCDSVNFLFAPSQYRDVANGENGQWLERNAEKIASIGKIELSETSIGVLRSVRNASRLRIPDPWNLDVSRGMLQKIGRRGQVVDPGDLDRIDPNRLPVLFDAGTRLVTDEEVAALERYVRAGGTFVATTATGRDGPEEANVWPIARLTGLRPVSDETRSGNIRFAEGQTLWPGLRGKELLTVGLGFEKASRDDPNIEAVANWKDVAPGKGSLAVASRRIGKGRVIVLGCTFWREERMAGDRWEPTPGSFARTDELFRSLGIPAASTVTPFGRLIFAEKRRSKNGLYDIYMVSRLESKGEKEKFRVTFHSPPPGRLFEISAQGHPAVATVAADTHSFSLPELELGAMECRIFAAPATQYATGPVRWLESLAGRWGPLAPLSRAEPLPKQKPSPWIVSLADGWTATPEASKNARESRQVRLGLFDTMGLDPNTPTVFRKTVTLPPSWRKRRVELLFDSPCRFQVGVFPRATLTINGIDAGMRFNEYEADQAVPVTIPNDGRLEFVLTVDGRPAPGKRLFRPVGVAGMFYLLANPYPLKSREITQWSVCREVGTSVAGKPGTVAEFRYLEARFTLPHDWPRENVFLEIDYPFGMLGWLELNGRVVCSTLTEEAPYRQLLIDGLLVKPDGENILRWSPWAPWLPTGKPTNMVLPKARVAVWPDRPYAPAP